MDDNVYIIPQASQNASFANRIRAITRKCSFCNCQGHNIKSCNNVGLTMFFQYLVHLKDETMSINNENRILSIQSVERYLYNFCSQHDSNTKLIKSLSCRFCGTRLRSTLQVSINKIIMHLFDIDCMTLSLHEYNFIPFNEYTPVRISSIIDGILLNYMANNQINTSTNDYKNGISINYNIVMCEMSDSSNIHTIDLETEMECSICYNSTKKIDSATFECQHDFCIECTETLLQKKHSDCPYCRNKIDKITCYNEESYNKLQKTTKIF